MCEIWFLDESRGHMEWVLRKKIDLRPIHAKYLSVQSGDGPWIQQSHDPKAWLSMDDITLKLVEDNTEALPKDDFEWDSNDENVVATADLPRGSDYFASSLECVRKMERWEGRDGQ
jgi:hypothetical protein